MPKVLIAMLFFGFQIVFAQQKVAILNTEDDGEPPIKHNELNVLTAKLRDIARKNLPKDYEVMTEQSIQSFLGSQKEMERVCNAADGCLAKIGRDIEADYIGQARIVRFGKFFAIKMEIYDSRKGTLVGSFTDDASKDIYALSAVIDKKAPDTFKEIFVITSVAPATPVPVTTLPAVVTKPSTTPQTTSRTYFDNKKCDEESKKAKTILDKCAKMGKNASGYQQCAEEYKNQKVLEDRICRPSTTSLSDIEAAIKKWERLSEYNKCEDENTKRNVNCPTILKQLQLERTKLEQLNN